MRIKRLLQCHKNPQQWNTAATDNLVTRYGIAVTNLTLKREQKRNNETRIDIAVGNMGNLK